MNNLIQSRDLAMIARWHQCGTMTSQMLARASFSAICLTVFPFEFRPRTFTIGFYGKKSFISELMILECSFPLIIDQVEMEEQEGDDGGVFLQLAGDELKRVTNRLDP